MFQKKCLCNFWKLRGGVSQKSTWLEGRGWAKVHVGPQGGRGGQKRPKNGPHGLCMTPNVNPGFSSISVCTTPFTCNLQITLAKYPQKIGQKMKKTCLLSNQHFESRSNCFEYETGLHCISICPVWNY